MNSTLDELWSTDLPPFAAGIDEGAQLVMMSSAEYPAVDDRPAVLSPTWISDILRRQLGFDGVVISDALDTPALDTAGSVGTRAVLAAQAGVDLFIVAGPEGCVDVQRDLASAIRSREIGERRARRSYRRLAALRNLQHEPATGV